MNADQFRRRLQCHLLGDRIAPVAALRDVALIAEALHQHGPRACDALGIPAGRRRLARKAVAGQRRNHDVERVEALPPYAVGLVSGSMTFICSMIEPGHPWVMMTAARSACFERTWMKWMSSRRCW